MLKSDYRKSHFFQNEANDDDFFRTRQKDLWKGGPKKMAVNFFLLLFTPFFSRHFFFEAVNLLLMKLKVTLKLSHIIIV